MFYKYRFTDKACLWCTVSVPSLRDRWGTSGRYAWAERNRNFELSTKVKFYYTHFHILFRDVALAQKQEMAVLLIFNKPSWLFCNQRLLCYFPKKIVMLLLCCFSKTDFYTSFCFKFVLFCIFIQNCSRYVNINFVFQIMAIIYAIIYIHIYGIKWKVSLMTWKAAYVKGC